MMAFPDAGTYQLGCQTPRLLKFILKSNRHSCCSSAGAELTLNPTKMPWKSLISNGSTEKPG